MSFDSSYRQPSEFALQSVTRFLRNNALAVLVLSAVILIPCFWHSRIQAGDLGSHVYNAWLAQLIERHQVAGLTIVRQSNNVLFDLLVLHTANFFGFVAAEKIVVSAAVLVFFWGSFSFLYEFSGRAPWAITPILSVLAYGYVFHMGFMNYYLSLGFALFALALAWRGGAGNWILVAAIAVLSLLAHPIGFLLIVTVTVYVRLWRIAPGSWRLVFPAFALAIFVLLRAYFTSHPALQPDWRTANFLKLLGQDQINIFGRPFAVLAWATLAWGLASGGAGIYDWVFRGTAPSHSFRLACELCLVAAFATTCVPENFRLSIYAGWIGLLVSRLTLITAILALLILASLRLPRWSAIGGALCAAFFFVYLYQATAKLDRMEANARAIVSTLPPGTRIVAVANAPDFWRIMFVYHSIERACVGHCFSYANYEPSSLQFRIRALPGSFFVTDSAEVSEAMSSGDYIVREADLPLISIYQCDAADFTKLCALPLRAGQKTEDPESDPAPESESDSE